LIAAICASTSMFRHRGILNGRKACSYPGFEEDLKGADVTMESVAVSDHVITSRGMGTAIDFGLAVVEAFKGAEEAEKLAKQIIYK